MKELEELIPQMENLIQDKATLEDQVALLPATVSTPSCPIQATPSLLTVPNLPLAPSNPPSQCNLSL